MSSPIRTEGRRPTPTRLDGRDEPPTGHASSDGTLGASVPPEPGLSRIWSHLPVVAALVAGLILVVGTIGPPLFGQGVFLAGDAITQAYPWRAFDDPNAENVAHHGPIGDTIDSGTPARTVFYGALTNGEFLSWNPYVAGGKPQGAQSSNGVLNPFAFSAYVLAPAWFAPALIKLATMAAAIGFTFLFCRRLGAGRAPAIFGGLAFAGSGFMVMWTNWTQPEVAALVPALFWATERFLQRPRISAAAPIPLALAAMLLGNFPAIVLYALYILAPYVLVRVAYMHGESLRRRLSTLAGAGTAVVTGVLLVAATLVPFALTLGDTGTGSRAEHPDNHLRLQTLLTAGAPKAFGLSTEGPSEAYFGVANQIEAISFVGATTAILAIIGLALPRLASTPLGARGVLVGATVVLGWATFVGGDLLGLLQRLPAFDNSFVGRTRSVLGFTVAVLAALGVQAVADRRWPAGRRQWAWAAGVIGATGLVTAIVGHRALEFARAAERAEVLRGGLILPAIIAVLAIGCITLARLGGRRAAMLAVACLPALLVVESLDLSLPLLPNEDRDSLYPSTPGIDHLADAVGDDGRFAPEGLTLFGSASAMFGLRSVAGHAFYSTEWKEALRTIDADAFRHSPTFPFLAGTPDVMASPFLDRMGVGWYAGSPQSPPPGDRVTTRAADPTCDQTVRLGDDVAATVPVRAGARALVVRACEPVRLPYGATLTARLDGAAAPGRAHLPTDVAPGELTIGLPAEGLAAPGGAPVRLSLDDSGGRSLALAAAADGGPVVDVIRPVDDGLRLVYADDLRIYERTRALDRIRWADRAVTVANEAVRLEQLASGRVPRGTVVLDEAGPEGSGRPARIDVTEDTPSGIAATVEADGDGYLVVADSIRHEWVATVDGEPADLVAADHAGAAVHVPAGRHEVRVAYRPPGQRAGLAVSGVSALALVSACVWDVRRRRRAAAAEPSSAAVPKGVSRRPSTSTTDR